MHTHAHTHTHTHIILLPRANLEEVGCAAEWRCSCCFQQAAILQGQQDQQALLCSCKYCPHTHWENDPTSRNRIMLSQRHLIQFSLFPHSYHHLRSLGCLLKIPFLTLSLTKMSFKLYQTQLLRINLGVSKANICWNRSL